MDYKQYTLQADVMTDVRSVMPSAVRVSNYSHTVQYVFLKKKQQKNPTYTQKKEWMNERGQTVPGHQRACTHVWHLTDEKMFLKQKYHSDMRYISIMVNILIITKETILIFSTQIINYIALVWFVILEVFLLQVSPSDYFNNFLSLKNVVDRTKAAYFFPS